MSPFFYTQTLFLFYSISLFTLSSFHTACLYLSLYFLHSNYLSNLLSLSLKHTLSSFHTIFYLTHTLSLSLCLSLSLSFLYLQRKTTTTTLNGTAALSDGSFSGREKWVVVVVVVVTKRLLARESCITFSQSSRRLRPLKRTLTGKISSLTSHLDVCFRLIYIFNPVGNCLPRSAE